MGVLVKTSECRLFLLLLVDFVNICGRGLKPFRTSAKLVESCAESLLRTSCCVGWLLACCEGVVDICSGPCEELTDCEVTVAAVSEGPTVLQSLVVLSSCSFWLGAMNSSSEKRDGSIGNKSGCFTSRYSLV